MPHREVRWRRLRRHPDRGLVADTGPRWHTHLLDWLDIPAVGDLGDIGTAISVIVATIVAGLLLWFVVIPVLLSLLDVILLIILTLVGLAAHLLAQRPWEVEASCADRRLRWLAGRRGPIRPKVNQVAVSLRRGVLPGGSVDDVTRPGAPITARGGGAAAR